MKRIRSLFWGIRFRGALLGYYLLRKRIRKRTSWQEMRFHLFSPGMYAVARRSATLVRSDGLYRYYRIQEHEQLFSYPAAAPLYSLAMILAEARPQHWHYYEIPQTAVAPGDVVVDCGSAEGFFAFRHQHHAGRIYALEPLPLFVAALQQLFRQQERVTILPVAAGASCGKAYIHTASSDTILDAAISATNGNGQGVEVELVTLDSLFADKGIRIHYLKADIEGFEEQMIRGALRTIRESKPKIAITTYHEGQDYQQLVDMIRNEVPEYQYLVKGIHYRSGNPVMLHMWVQ
ncbi:FkbM family methyltransferase [Chitinophaga agrisoli]|nr:FkbM family methyltransferase [Chitinophaga agrisoli]